MRTAPLILIPPSKLERGVQPIDVSLNLAECYAQAVIAAGGIPWVAPRFADAQMAAECVRRSDGLLLVGGDDVQPKLYARRLPPKLARTVTLADAERDVQELLLISEVFRQRRPLFAICRGLQILNVALGGTLVVDIATQMPNAINHQRTDRKAELVHDVLLKADSLMAKLAGARKLGANSSHHQAVGRVAKLLRVTATSPDGVVEGLELNHRFRESLPFLLAVQSHPERLYRRHREYFELFRGFVQACAARRKQKV